MSFVGGKPGCKQGSPLVVLVVSHHSIQGIILKMFKTWNKIGMQRWAWTLPPMLRRGLQLFELVQFASALSQSLSQMGPLGWQLHCGRFYPPQFLPGWFWVPALLSWVHFPQLWLLNPVQRPHWYVLVLQNQLRMAPIPPKRVTLVTPETESRLPCSASPRPSSML